MSGVVTTPSSWTMALAMQACAKLGKEIHCHRPPETRSTAKRWKDRCWTRNFASFVGLYPVPVRHGLTIGEMALWVNEGLGVGADLDVVRMKGWRRSMYFEETGLPWVLPSPICPRWTQPLFIRAGCLIEGQPFRRPWDHTPFRADGSSVH